MGMSTRGTSFVSGLDSGGIIGVLNKNLIFAENKSREDMMNEFSRGLEGSSEEVEECGKGTGV